jgi:vacuolar-type H+-ATPase subunit I/STV1
MKNRKNNKLNKLRQMLDSLNDDSSKIDKYKEVAYNIGAREFGTGHMSDHDKNKTEEILNMLRSKPDNVKQPKSKVEPQSGISRYEDLKYELEELEMELSHTSDFLDGALAQPGESPELLSYISEMTQVQAELIKEVKNTRLKLGLDRA